MTNNIGQTIAQQIGNRAFTMIGARGLVALEDGLQFSVGRNAKKVTKLVVKLDADDTYTVTAWNIRGVNCRELASHSFVYADQLHTVIESLTGMYTSL